MSFHCTTNTSILGLWGSNIWGIYTKYLQTALRCYKVGNNTTWKNCIHTCIYICMYHLETEYHVYKQYVTSAGIWAYGLILFLFDMKMSQSCCDFCT